MKMDLIELVKLLGLPAAFVVAWASLKGKGHEQKKFEIERKDILIEKCLPIFRDENLSDLQTMEIESAFHSYSGVEACHELIAPIMRSPKRFELARRLKKARHQFKYDEDTQQILRANRGHAYDTAKAIVAIVIYSLFSFVFWYQTTFTLPDAITLAKNGENYFAEAKDFLTGIALYLSSLLLLKVAGQEVISSMKLEEIYNPDHFSKHPLFRAKKTLKHATKKSDDFVLEKLSSLMRWLSNLRS